ncbi:MAG TPA: hypothetical protein VFA63_11340 [Pseudonocardiaceae bacterium]|nr:hypothetical protein [Pseudonocardiaceae bacterium]
MPSRIGTATFAVFVTAHEAALEDGGGAAAHAEEVASTTAKTNDAHLLSQRTAPPDGQDPDLPDHQPSDNGGRLWSD